MATTPGGETGGEGTPPAGTGGRGRRLKLVLVALVVLALAGGAYMVLLKPKSGGPAAAPAPVPGVVVKLDPITVNLAGGHFLKLGLALQASAEAGEDVSGAKALDAAISLFTGRTVNDLATTSGRQKAKATLVKQVDDLYEHKVYDVYFTDFVMQ